LTISEEEKNQALMAYTRPWVTTSFSLGN